MRYTDLKSIDNATSIRLAHAEDAIRSIYKGDRDIEFFLDWCLSNKESSNSINYQLRLENDSLRADVDSLEELYGNAIGELNECYISME